MRRSHSAWPRDASQRLGHNSVYHPKESTTHSQSSAPEERYTSSMVSSFEKERYEAMEAVLKSSILESEGYILELRNHISASEDNLMNLRSLLASVQRRARAAARDDHPVLDSRDMLFATLGHLSPCSISKTLAVNKRWLKAGEEVLVAVHGPMMHPDVLRPLMASMPDLLNLAVCGRVCKAWRAASRFEREVWQSGVETELSSSRRRSSMLQVDHQPPRVSLVDLILRVSGRIGLDVMSCGGLASTLRYGLRALGLMNVLTNEERTALSPGPSLTVIARPDEQADSDEEETTFVVAGVEHIFHDVIIWRLAHAMAKGLLLLLPTERDDDDEAVDGRARNPAGFLLDRVEDA